MPPLRLLKGRSVLCVGALLSVFGSSTLPSKVSAQALPFHRDYPGSGPYQCLPFAAITEPGPDERNQARQLASTADQAIILGDLERARALLARATELDPASTQMAYRHARVLEDLGQTGSAMDEFCRVLAGDATADGVQDARQRLEDMVAANRMAIPEPAVEAFELGLSMADDGLMEGAAESFGVAVEEGPEWADAAYNRAAALARLGEGAEAVLSFQRYLELRPEAPDAIAVSQRIGQLEGVSLLRTPSPSTALTVGVLLPGMGQFYSGRHAGGLAVLSIAAAAATAGFLIEEINVQCLITVGPNEPCPPGQVASQETDRPFLLPGLATAVTITIIGAIEAYVKARGRRDRGVAAPTLPASSGSHIEGPSISTSGSRVNLSLLRFMHR